MDVIRAAQLHHILPPIALGVRRGSVLHKVHAVLHRLRLEAESFMDVQRMLDATHSITADLGAEAEIVRLSVNASAFFRLPPLVVRQRRRRWRRRHVFQLPDDIGYGRCRGNRRR